MATHHFNSLSDTFSSNHSASCTPSDSPPSLIYSDISDDSEDTITPAMASTSTQDHGQRIDASMVVQQVLGKLDHVCEHLRNRGENDAANSIAKNTIEIVETFNQVTAPWDLQMFLMAPPSQRPRPGLANAGTATQPRPAVATAGSWASVAASAVKKNKNGIIKYAPSDTIVKRYVEPEATPEDMRVVWVQGWKPGRPLGQITQYITQGPICSMAYSSDHEAICIIFQFASSAQSLVESSAMYEEETGECLFGHGCGVIMGQPYPMTTDLKRMGAPTHERRRLTFARSQLFAHGMTETRFRDDIYDMVGEANVELVWLFNTGNATVVFSSSKIAAIVRERFLEKSRRAGSYQNVHVSFSHDPCEKPMNLITQLDSPSSGRFRSDSVRSQENHPDANGNGLSRSNTRNGGGLSRRESRRRAAKKDADGWQTVTHKK